MCTRYITPEQREIEALWRISGMPPIERDPEIPSAFDSYDYGKDVFPAMLGPAVRIDRHPDQPAGKVLVLGQFGLIPQWVKAEEFAKRSRMYGNVRSETAHQMRPYQAAWKFQNWCVIPAQGVYDPCYDAEFVRGLNPRIQLPPEKSIPVRVTRTDGKPIWIAGLFWVYKHPLTEKLIETFSMLTVNADDHPLYKHMHKPFDDDGKPEEKRMVVMLEDEEVEPWLASATPEEARKFLDQFPAEKLTAEIVPLAPRPKKPKPEPPKATPEAQARFDEIR